MSKEAKEFLLKPESAKLSISQIMQSFADEQNKKEKQRHALEELTQTSTIDELGEEVKKLEGENKELKQQLEGMEKVAMAATSSEVTLHEENQKLKKQLEEAKRKVSDTLNLVKSELKEEEHSKLSKTMNPYRTDKIKFLRRTINHLNQEG